MSNPSPKPYKLQVVYDIRSWVEEYAEELHAHTVPKCFKFKCNDAGKAEMFYRNWSHEDRVAGTSYYLEGKFVSF